MKYLAAILMVLLLVGSSGAQENSITVDIGGQYGFAWTANSEPDLAGYRLYRSATSGQYSFGAENAEAEYGLVTESPHYAAPNTSGTFYFVLTAFDNEGFESQPSNEQTLHVENQPPGAPGGCAILKF